MPSACPDIKWSKSDAHKLYFAAGNNIIRTSTESSFDQEFFKGHTSPVSCLDISADGQYLASCQEGECPSLRVFNTTTMECLCKADLALQDVRCLSLSYNGKYIAVVGNDRLMRDEITVLELDNSPYEKDYQTVQKWQILRVARQVSEFNILTVKFSPTELDKLVSCGQENIRFWRIKNEHLPGGPVV